MISSKETAINASVRLSQSDGRLAVTLYGAPFMSWEEGDRETRRTCIALLAVHGFAKQTELVEAFRIGRTTLHYWIRAWNQDGVNGLVSEKRGPKGPSVAKGKMRQRILCLGRAGYSMRQAAAKLGISLGPVRGLYQEMKLGVYAETPSLFEAGHGGTPEESETSNGNATGAAPQESEAAVCSESPLSPDIDQTRDQEEMSKEGPPAKDHGPADASSEVCDGEQAAARSAPEPTTGPARDQEDLRSTIESPAPKVGPGEGAPFRVEDRAFAKLRLLEEAEVQFVSGQEVPNAGVLIAMALFSRTKLFDVAQQVYGRLRPAFYGLGHLLRVLCVMAMLRLKRTEHLASVSPPALGRVLGLDRAPEVKTVRRKLGEIAAKGKATVFLATMADAWAKEAKDAIGFLLADGHVRTYTGKRNIHKAYNTRRRLVEPGITDYWVNDNEGQPLFLITSPVNRSLRDILPELLQEATKHTGGKNFTIKFDRGGADAKLFRRIRDDGYHFMTYRVKRYRDFPKSRFRKVEKKVNGRLFKYELYDTHINLNGYGRIRCVAVIRDDGRQTHILTSREDLDAFEVAYEMFGRWRQENFFKYMSEQFALDALVSYGLQDDDEERQITNPKRKPVERRRNKVRQEIKRIEAHLGRIENGGSARGNPYPGMTVEELRTMLDRKRTYNQRLNAQLNNLPKKVAIKDAEPDQKTVLLEGEQKRFTDEIKIAAYRVETQLLGMLGPHYARSEQEGRALIRSIMKTTGEFEATDKSLTVHLRPLSAPRHTHAMAALCEQINQLGLHFPGTKIRLKFAVRPAECSI